MTPSMDSLLTGIERVNVGQLALHPRNPRRGDVDMIAESLAENAQYAPLVVQRSTGHVLAGNHTLMAAQRLEWDSIDVVFVDVPDDQATKILLSANRTADAGTYENRALADLLGDLPDLAGTGYSPDELDDLLAGLEELPDYPPREPGQPLLGDGADGGAAEPAPSGMRQTHSYMEDGQAYADTDTRMIILAYPIAEYGTVVERLGILAERYQTESNAATVAWLLARETATE